MGVWCVLFQNMHITKHRSVGMIVNTLRTDYKIKTDNI